MKIEFSGQKLGKAKGCSNLYIDSGIPKEILKMNDVQSAIKKRLKEFNHKKSGTKNCYVVVFLKNTIEVVKIRNMEYYRKIAKAFNATDVEFLHNYLTHHTGTGKIMFPPKSFEAVKKLYLK
jgi:hypothetical protein